MIKSIIAQYAGVDSEEVSNDSSMLQLGIESMQLILLQRTLKEEYGLSDQVGLQELLVMTVNDVEEKIT